MYDLVLAYRSLPPHPIHCLEILLACKQSRMLNMDNKTAEVRNVILINSIKKENKKKSSFFFFFLLPSTCFIYVPETLYSSNWNHLRGPFAQRANWCLRWCRITAAILSWSNVADMIMSLWMRSTGQGGAVGVRSVLYPLIIAFHGVSVLARTEGGRGEIAEDVN